MNIDWFKINRLQNCWFYYQVYCSNTSEYFSWLYLPPQYLETLLNIVNKWKHKNWAEMRKLTGVKILQWRLLNFDTNVWKLDFKFLSKHLNSWRLNITVFDVVFGFIVSVIGETWTFRLQSLCFDLGLEERRKKSFFKQQSS